MRHMSCKISSELRFAEFSGSIFHLEQPHAQFLSLFPITFGIIFTEIRFGFERLKTGCFFFFLFCSCVLLDGNIEGKTENREPTPEMSCTWLNLVGPIMRP